MARNILNQHKNLTIFNRSLKPMEKLRDLGASAAKSYVDAVKDADIVFTMLSTPEVVEEVSLSENGFVRSMKKNSIWVDCSTVNPSFSKKAGSIAKEKNIRFIDAPVSGSKPNADAGDLIFYVSSDNDDLFEISTFLKMMGSKIVRIGGIGKGTSFKVLVNSMLAQSMLIFSETVLLGEKLGLSKDFLLDTLPDLGVCAPFINAKTEMIREYI